MKNHSLKDPKSVPNYLNVKYKKRDIKLYHLNEYM